MAAGGGGLGKGGGEVEGAAQPPAGTWGGHREALIGGEGAALAFWEVWKAAVQR